MKKSFMFHVHLCNRYIKFNDLRMLHISLCGYANNVLFTFMHS